MKLFNPFIKFDYLISVAILFYIIFVFINFTHNSFDPYKKINLEFSTEQETFIKSEGLSFKKEVSDNLASDEPYKNILNRECEITGHTHDRHKVRWVKALILKNIFQKSYEYNNYAPYYLHILLHSFIIFFSLLLITKTFPINKKYIYLFLLYLTFFFQQHLGEYSYSIFEMFFLSLSLYASKNKNYFLFLISCVLATLNRESGFIILFTWLIFNNFEYKQFLSFIFLTSILFILVNYDILECLFMPKFYVPLKYIEGHINFYDLKNMNLFSAIKILSINYILPFTLGLYFYFNSIVKNKFLLLLFLIYLATFLLAAPFNQPSTRLILLPLIFCSIYFCENKKNFS